jgi:hypothetical protein
VKYVEALHEYTGSEPSLFLAGGITGCDDWQTRLVQLLSGSSLVLFNPRRRDFPIDDPRAAEEQIKWEFRYLRRATARLFWFPPQTLCPITLYELGAWSMTSDSLFVGVDPRYQRKRDVEIQTRLARPNVTIVFALEDLAAQVLRWVPGMGNAPERSAGTGPRTEPAAR